MSAPARIRLRMYQVGFGDCFLLTFEYGKPLEDGRSERHVLIDFGTMRKHPKWDHVETAQLIAKHCGGRLDAIVVTHRHQDHLSGFGHPQAAAIIGSLLREPVVIRSWTEDPAAPSDATSVRVLAAAHGFAQAVSERMPPRATGLRGDIRALALNQVANADARANLDRWAADGVAKYVSIGDDSGLENVLPDVTVSVLGPPTIEEWPSVIGNRRSDPEYWMLAGRQLQADSFAVNLASAFDDTEPDDDSESDDSASSARGEPLPPPGPIRWVVERLQRQRLFLLQRVVETMDDSLNNTSVILLFEAAGIRLLFPGDAQIENWEYVLRHYEDEGAGGLRDGLAAVDLYKVGHHGSRNATPKLGLYGRWSRPDRRKLTSVVSTKTKVHGKIASTRVPRATLLTALTKLGALHGTHHLKSDEGYVELVADTQHFTGFEVAT